MQKTSPVCFIWAQITIYATAITPTSPVFSKVRCYRVLVSCFIFYCLLNSLIVSFILCMILFILIMCVWFDVRVFKSSQVEIIHLFLSFSIGKSQISNEKLRNDVPRPCQNYILLWFPLMNNMSINPDALSAITLLLFILVPWVLPALPVPSTLPLVICCVWLCCVVSWIPRAASSGLAAPSVPAAALASVTGMGSN